MAPTSKSTTTTADDSIADSCKPLHAKCTQGDQCCSNQCYVDNQEGKGIWRCGDGN